MNRFKALFVGAAFALAAGAAAIPTIASADTTWLIEDATFDDGGTLTGTFTLNQYGYLETASLTTSAGGVLGGQSYDATSNASNGATYLDFNPGYTTDLHIVFADSLTTGESHNDIVAGSYECEGSYSCYVPEGGTVRYLIGGYATYVPEPATWAMMVLGLGLIGGGIRLTRDKRGLSAA